MVTALVERGLAVVDGLVTRAELLRLALSIATVVPHRDSAPDGVTTLTDLGEVAIPSGFAGFSAVALNPHTDRSGAAVPPALLMMGCSTSAASGGQCVLVDGQAVLDDLATSEPEALRAFRTQRSALFGGASGHLGSILTDVGRGRLVLRFRSDELARIDAVRARGDAEAMALRTDGSERPGIAWERTGTLADVVEALQASPAPAHRLAPRLFLATGPTPPTL